MKKILLVVFGALLLGTLCTSCSSSKRFDTAAEDRGVKPLSQQVVEAIKADTDFQTLTYKAHKDEIVWVSNKKGRKGWQIQAYNPDPVMSPFGRFIRLRWLHSDVSFVGSFKSVKLSDEEQQDILEALQPLFESIQKAYIEKNNKKYHQVEWPGDRGADDVNDDQLSSTSPLLFQKGIFFIVSLEKLKFFYWRQYSHQLNNSSLQSDLFGWCTNLSLRKSLSCLRLHLPYTWVSQRHVLNPPASGRPPS